jgi:O-antigen/teichoic acid export membrane protein
MDKKSRVDVSVVRVISDSFFYSVSRVAILVLKPFKGIILGNLLGPSLYGILNIPSPYILIASMLSNVGFNTTVLNLMPAYLHEERPDLARMIYRSSAFLTIMLSAVWAVLLLAFSPWLADKVAHEPDAVNPMRLYALAIPFLAVNTFFASVYMAVQRGKLGAVISFFYGLLNTALPVAAVLWHRNITLIVGGILAAEVLGAALFTFYFHTKVLSGLGAAVGPLWRGIKETMSFGYLFFIAGLGFNLINSVDRLMIKYYLPADQLGFYSMAAQIIMVMSVVTATLGLALVPSLTAARKAGDQATFRKLVHNSARLGFITLVPIAVCGFALCRDFFSLLLPRFGPSVTIVEIIISIGFIDLFCRISWASLVAHERGGLSAVAYIAAAAWNIASNWLLIPRYGIIGAAVSVLTTFVVLAAILVIMMKRVSSADIDLKGAAHPLFLSLGYVLLGWLFRDLGPPARLVVVLLAGSLVYAAAAFTTGLIRKEDLDKVREILTPRAAVPHVRFALGVIGVLDRVNRSIGRSR